MKNRRGFTLIELLAVILILGIIMLIAIPVVNNAIKTSRMQTYKSSIQNLVSAIEQECNVRRLHNETLEKEYVLEDGFVTPTLSNLKGQIEGTGVISVNSECKTDVLISNDSYEVTKNTYQDEVEIKVKAPVKELKKYNDGEVVYFNPTSNKSCSENEYLENVNETSKKKPTGLITGCLRWFAYGDTSKDNTSLKLLLGHNAYPTATSRTYKGGDANIGKLKTAWNDAEFEYNVREINTSELALITGSSFDPAKSSGLTITSYAWLFDNLYSCKAKGCETEDNELYYSTSSGSKGTIGYATSDFKTSSALWTVTYQGVLTTQSLIPVIGTRPVITINKKLL